MTYGAQWVAMIERAKAAPATSVPAEVRRAEIIALHIQGMTIPQMRAIYVAHYSGAPMPRGARRAEVALRLQAAALEAVTPKPVDPDLFARTAPAWNCISDPDGPHYTPGTGRCEWCGKDQATIAAEYAAREGMRS